MEYQGTILDYVRHAKFRKTNNDVHTVKTLHMPENQSYTFYAASDGLAVMSGDDLTWTLTAPDAMFCFKEFTTVGDFIDALIEYLPDNPVYTWDELADELTDATVLGNISTALGSGGVTVRGNTNTYTGTNTALASPDGFADVAAWLGAICEAASGSIRSAPISEILQIGEDGRVYRLRVVGASTITITFKLTAYIEPGKVEDDGDAVVYNSNWVLYYSSLKDAIEDAEAGETLYLIRDYTLTENVSIPAGVTLIIPSGPALIDTSTGNNSFGRIHGGAAYVTLTIPAGKTLTVKGELIVAGNQQSWYVDIGGRTGNYGAVYTLGNVIVSGSLYARGIIYGSGRVRVTTGAFYTPMHVTDWRGGTASYMAYSSKVWPFSHYNFGCIQCCITVRSTASLYGMLYAYCGGSGYYQSVEIIGSNGLFSLVGNTTGDINPTSSGHDIVILGNCVTGDVSITISGSSLSTVGSYFPLPPGIHVVIASPSSASSTSLMSITNKIKLLPGSGITVQSGASLAISSDAALAVYAASDYSGNYYNHYTYAVDIGPDAALEIDSGATLTNDGLLEYSGNGALTVREYSQTNQATVYVSFHRA